MGCHNSSAKVETIADVQSQSTQSSKKVETTVDAQSQSTQSSTKVETIVDVQSQPTQSSTKIETIVDVQSQSTQSPAHQEAPVDKSVHFSEHVSIKKIRAGGKTGSGHTSEKKKLAKVPSMPGVVPTDPPPPARGTLLRAGEASAKAKPSLSPVEYII